MVGPFSKYMGERSCKSVPSPFCEPQQRKQSLEKIKAEKAFTIFPKMLI